MTANMTNVIDEPVGFYRYAPRHRDETCIIGPEDESLTWGQMHDAVDAWSNLLRSEGMQVEDVVAVLARNSVTVVQLYLAAMQTGLYYVPINHHGTVDDVAHILADSGAALLVTDDANVDVATWAADSAGLARTQVVVDGVEAFDGARAVADVVASAPAGPPTDRVGGQIMQYTSGTTGRPKGVRRPVSGADADTSAAAVAWLFEAFAMERHADDVWLVTSPLYHTANISAASIAIHHGATLVLMDGWDPEAMLELVERHRVTGMHLVPTQFVRLLALPQARRDAHDLSSLRYVLHGAAPCPVEVKQEMLDWWGPIIHEYYGSTEVGATLARPQEWLERPGTVGRPFSITEVRILGDDNELLPPGEVGRVFMRQGDQLITYKDDPEKTERSRVGDFMTVGDLGYLDEDGFLFLVGRDAEIIISGGVNIYPAEIESVVLSTPGVVDATVVGIPDPEFGEQVRAVVVPAADVDPDAVIARVHDRCADQLARYKRPRGVDIVDTLPRDPNGKLRKHEVRRRYWESADD